MCDQELLIEIQEVSISFSSFNTDLMIGGASIICTAGSATVPPK